MNKEVPDDLDWVTTHTKCSVAAVFETLRQQVQADVENLQEKLGPDSSRVFRFISSNPSAFAVIAEENPATWVTNNAVGRVAFDLKNKKIQINGVGVLFDRGTAAPHFEATTTVSDEGKCRLKVESRELTFWQLRKMALEGLFFGTF